MRAAALQPTMSRRKPAPRSQLRNITALRAYLSQFLDWQLSRILHVDFGAERLARSRTVHGDAAQCGAVRFLRVGLA